jgi:hypothetical protein
MSKMLRAFESGDIATIDRPSGDQRGENMPSDPGIVVTWRLARSRMRRTLFWFWFQPLQNTILRPSGDQFGSVW